MRRVRNGVCVLVVFLAWGSTARAQQPVTVAQTTTAAPQGLHGSAGFGLSLTDGNSDTLNINATVDNTYDPKTKNAMRWNALFLRGKQNGVLSVYRVSAMFRDEYTVNGRVFMFAEMDALHDTFKGVDYILAPAAGVGYKVIDTMRTSFNVDGGIGGVVERDTGMDAIGNGAITLSEKLVHQLTEWPTLRALRAHCPAWGYDVLDRIRRLNHKPPAALPEPLRASLRRRFRDDVRETQDLLGLDLSTWLQPV